MKDSLIYGIGGILTKGINLILLPVYVKILMPEDYGVMDFLVVFFTLAGVFFSLEIYQAIARYYHEFDDEHERKKNISTAFLFTVVSYFVFAFLVVVFSRQIAEAFFHTYTKEGLPMAISLAAMSTYFGALYTYCGNILRYSLRAKKYAGCSFINSLLNIAGSILFVLYLDYGIKGVFLGQLLGNSVAFIIAFRLLKNDFVFYFDLSKLKLLLRFSFPLVPSSIGVFLLAYLDRIIIKHYLTISDLGVYGVASRFASLASLIMMSINTAITPLIYENYKKETTSNDIAIIFSFLVSFIVIIVSGVTLFSKEILYIFTTPDYYRAAFLFPFLFLTGFLSKMYDFVPGLSIAKKTKMIACIYLFGAILTIIIDLLTIQRFGIFAVAVANLFSAVVVFAVNYFFSQRYYRIHYDLKRILMICLLSTLLVFVSFRCFNEISFASLLYKTVIFLLILSLPFVFKLVKISYFLNMIDIMRKTKSKI